MTLFGKDSVVKQIDYIILLVEVAELEGSSHCMVVVSVDRVHDLWSMVAYSVANLRNANSVGMFALSVLQS